MNSDRDIWKQLFQKNREWNEKQFKSLAKSDEILAERLNEVESAIVSHSRRSLNNSQNLYLLLCGVFLCFFVLVLLGTSIEGQVGTSKISYSSNGVFQFALSALSLGGGGVAIAQLPIVKRFFKK
jgi:hypothetical protein